MRPKPLVQRVAAVGKEWGGQERCYLLAALLGLLGILLVVQDAAPRWGLAALLASSLSLGLGLLIHSAPEGGR